MDEKIYYSWETAEYNKKETSVDWFWAISIIAIIICVLAVLSKNYLLGILIVIGIGCVLYLKIREPKKIRITLTDQYIQIKEDEKYYQDIQAFWIEVTKDKTKPRRLLLAMKKSLAPLLAINLPLEIETEELRKKLLQHMEERQMASPVIYEMMEKLGF